MIIYRDILRGDEIVSDVYKIQETPDVGGVLWELDGAMVKPGQDSFVLEGANASAEGEDADDGDAEGDNTPVLNFARDFRYQKIDPPTVKEYQAETKKYLKNIMNKMTELGKSKEEIDAFKAGAPAALKKIAANWKNYDVYLGEGAEPDGQGKNMYILVDFREDGMTPFVLVWKHGLEEYKV